MDWTGLDWTGRSYVRYSRPDRIDNINAVVYVRTSVQVAATGSVVYVASVLEQTVRNRLLYLIAVLSSAASLA